MRSSSAMNLPDYLYMLESKFAICLSFPAVCLMIQSKIMRKSCYLLSLWLSGIHCMKVSKDLWSVKITNLCPLNLASKKCRLSIIANNYFWKVVYFNCTALNFQLGKQAGLIQSWVPCPINDPSPIALGSCIRYFRSLYPLFQAFKICEEFTTFFNLLKAWWWMSVQIHLMYAPYSSDQVLVSEASPARNYCK